MGEKRYLVFDVETAGLRGRAFAVGYVVVDEGGGEVSAGWGTCGLRSVPCRPDDTAWIIDNIPTEVVFPRSGGNEFLDRTAMIEWFCRVVADSKADLAADCGYPCEVSWLKECGIKAYPLHEIATALLMARRDPVGTYDRLENELPKHHPLADARQSARILLECLRAVGAVGSKEVQIPGFSIPGPWHASSEAT